MSDRTQSVVEDLNSTNGVFIRGQRIKHHALADGDYEWSAFAAEQSAEKALRVDRGAEAAGSGPLKIAIRLDSQSSRSV